MEADSRRDIIVGIKKASGEEKSVKPRRRGRWFCSRLASRHVAAIQLQSFPVMAPSQRNNFRNSKNQALGKRDKSSAGRIDPQAVQICAEINKLDRFFTYVVPRGARSHATRSILTF